MPPEKTNSVHANIKKVGSRRHAREAALQMLYLCDICKLSPEDAEKSFWGKVSAPSKSYDFAKILFKGICDNKISLDALISKNAKNWDMQRMATIDRNILRLSAFEITYMPETPISVIIDEAVEIAKLYSTIDSGKFVNGILDKLKTARNTK